MSSISEHIDQKGSLWWLKNAVKSATIMNKDIIEKPIPNLTSPNIEKLNLSFNSASVEDLFDNNEEYSPSFDEDVSEADIGSIIDEINKIASQSPIGNYDNPPSDKSVEEILQEAQKLYLESSKSFEQLSSRAKTPLEFSIPKSKSSISFMQYRKTSPSPILPPVLSLQLPKEQNNSDSDRTEVPSPEEYEDAILWEKEAHDLAQLHQEFPSEHIMSEPKLSPPFENKLNEVESLKNDIDQLFQENINELKENLEEFQKEELKLASNSSGKISEKSEVIKDNSNPGNSDNKINYEDSGSDIQDDVINVLHGEIDNLKLQLQEAQKLLKSNELNGNKQKCIQLQQELETVIEQMKDVQEQNTALQLQLDQLTKTHQELKISHDDLSSSKKILENRIAEIDANYIKCKSELTLLKEANMRLTESESNFKKQLEIERLQSKTSKLQSEKDAKCIQDLNRQVKEMERIIQRKHPDSVSALIVASKTESETALNSTRSFLENRIKQLETEASLREVQSTKVFTEVQEKFNNMKDKYERHIEDLEIHVNDLKNQLKSKSDTYDIYTQTYYEETRIDRDTTSIGIQTDAHTQPKQPKSIKKSEKIAEREPKEETHLLATIRGYQSDLSSKDKIINKLQKELEEVRKTNRRLQKEREMNLKGERMKDFKPEKLKIDSIHHDNDVESIKDERDKIKAQLVRMEEEFQSLKTKRIQDLNILQEAHEREITTYMSNIGPMREQLDVQQITISTLQGQLASCKEELAIITVERDHLDAKVKNMMKLEAECPEGDNEYQVSLQKKIAYLERRYEEREHRLRAIVHGLAQKQVTSGNCAQCAARQQQLIGYKAELDQLLATLRYLQ